LFLPKVASLDHCILLYSIHPLWQNWQRTYRYNLHNCTQKFIWLTLLVLTYYITRHKMYTQCCRIHCCHGNTTLHSFLTVAGVNVVVDNIKGSVLIWKLNNGFLLYCCQTT
jgi:hypothetical protein